MKRLPESWKVYVLLFTILLLVITVVGDQYSPAPNSKKHDVVPSHNQVHSHDHDKSLNSSNDLDKAFGQAPDPKDIPVDPEKEHQMAIFHYNEGNKFLNKGDWKEAVENYKMALHHDPALDEVYVNMSNAYLKGLQFENAKKTLDTLKMKDPENPHLYYNLACYYSLTEQVSASLEALQQSIRRGYKSPGDIHNDPDLENLRQTPEFQQWIKTL